MKSSELDILNSTMANLIQKQIFMFSVAVLLQYVVAEMGPVNLAVINAGKCEGTNYDFVELELVSLSEDDVGLTATIKSKYDLDTTISYEIRVDELADGQVKEGVFRHSGGYFCHDIEKFIGNMWLKFATAVGMPEGCPKPAGTYETVEFPIDYNDIKLDTFLYGRFMAHFQLKKMGQPITCVFFEFTNSPPGESVK